MGGEPFCTCEVEKKWVGGEEVQRAEVRNANCVAFTLRWEQRMAGLFFGLFRRDGVGCG